MARPVCDSVPAIAAEFADRTPKVAEVEYKFVDDAVVANVFVDVEFVIVALVPERVVIVPEFDVRVPIAPVCE